MDDRDRELSRLFDAERRADESSAPNLEALLGRTRTGRGIPAGRRIAYSLALASLITAAIFLVRGGAQRGVAPPTETVQLADWTSPTDFLLDTPGSELLTQIPTLASLPIAESNAAPIPTKGVAR